MKKLLSTLTNGRHRIVCPSCNGGNGRERSLSVELSDSSARWWCFRAGCEERGGWGNTQRMETNAVIKQAKDVDLQGYVRLPIKDCDGHCKGWEYRAISKRTQPKSKLNTDSDWCNLHFPSRITQGHVLLVEDRASANKMFPYFPTVALLGVHLNANKIEYMLQCGIKGGIIALDEDATSQAVKILREESFVSSILTLERDLKDEPPSRLLQITKRII
jgi:hypothetical protein